MSVQQSYNEWSQSYDEMDNKTRDLEAEALRQELAAFTFRHLLEAGCGTGKNTVWLKDKARQLTAVDVSEGMLARARNKVTDSHVQFRLADLLQPWDRFSGELFDAVTFSLVLEHVQQLDLLFEQMDKALNAGGYVYVGELHPFKQYTGSQARFGSGEGTHWVPCYKHHISDFTEPLLSRGYRILRLTEYFDDGDRGSIPRILAMLFQKGQ